MTEAEWLASDDPARMLAWGLRTRPAGGRFSPRTLRLCAAACVRHLGMAELYGEAAHVERLAEDAVLELPDDAARTDLSHADAAWAVVCVAGSDWGGSFLPAAWFYSALPAGDPRRTDKRRAVQKAKADVVRATFGNPFRPWACAPDWRTPTVRRLAAAAYARTEECPTCRGDTDLVWLDRLCDLCGGAGHVARATGTLDGQLLVVLADALEEAGCQPVACAACGGDGRVDSPVVTRPPLHATRPCPRCTPPGLWQEGTGLVTHPLLVALRAPGPKHLGFWPLDAVLDKC